jgi:hypothetical protein
MYDEDVFGRERVGRMRKHVRLYGLGYDYPGRFFSHGVRWQRDVELERDGFVGLGMRDE